MNSETQMQADQHHGAESKASEPEAKALSTSGIIGIVLLNVLSRVLERRMAAHWAFGISVLIVGLAFFPFRREHHRAYSFSEWSMIILLTSAGASLLLFVMNEVI